MWLGATGSETSLHSVMEPSELLLLQCDTIIVKHCTTALWFQYKVPCHRHAICHGCMDIIRVFFWVNVCSELKVFCQNSIFAVFHDLLVTHLVAHRFALGNPIIAIPRAQGFRQV